MVSVIDLSAVDRGFEPWSGQTMDYAFGICCFFKNLWVRNQDNVSEWWRDMSVSVS
jgi:hypothetical protein